jgi:tRNA (guanine37-N1)-methyltransferase
MRISILTLFPDMMEAVLGESIIGRARKKGLVTINCINIRDFSTDKHRRVDDYPYGGGCGMVMQAEPIYRAYQSLLREGEEKPFVIYLSPQGKVFCQQMALRLSKKEHLVLLCGHYEGVDERIIEEIVDMELSIGDYVLTGGEIPAMAVCDSVCRLVPGVLASDEAYMEESHAKGLLEYPQYTRPPEFMGRKVPEVLLSGHHANIQAWRKEQSIARTRAKRPDLFGEEPWKK